MQFIHNQNPYIPSSMFFPMGKVSTLHNPVKDRLQELIREELEKQKSITERIMNHLGIAKINK